MEQRPGQSEGAQLAERERGLKLEDWELLFFQSSDEDQRNEKEQQQERKKQLDAKAWDKCVAMRRFDYLVAQKKAQADNTQSLKDFYGRRKRERETGVPMYQPPTPKTKHSV